MKGIFPIMLDKILLTITMTKTVSASIDTDNHNGPSNKTPSYGYRCYSQNESELKSIGIWNTRTYMVHAKYIRVR